MSFSWKNSPLITTLMMFLLITLSNISTQVQGDSTLIQNVCTKTPHPKDCQPCLTNNSGASEVTIRELAGSAMYCTYNISLQLQKTFTGLASKADNPKIKKVYVECGSRLDNFAGKLAGAQNWWWDYNDKEAKNDFNGAKGEYLSCERALKELIKSVNHNYNLHSLVLGQFKVLGNLYWDSYAIILQSEGKSNNV